ncbi:MAG: hypothetical protein WBA59_08355 [Moheibacter sp.]
MPKLITVKRKDLDLKKYSNAIQTALNYRIYAEYWYLDTQTDEKWECLIYGDYEVVMPIPLQYKLGFKFVLQPFYSQQLGVFYKQEISKELFWEFETRLHKYRVRAYSFNEENTESFQPKGEKKVNQILNLNRPYELIQNHFSKDRIKDIRRNSKLNLILKEEFDFDLFFELRKEAYSELESMLDVNLTKKFIKSIIDSKKHKAFMLCNSDQEVLSMILFGASNSRLIQLFSVRNKSIEPKGAFPFLLNQVIKKFAESELILDFEGSMVPGIARRNESFGAEKKYYTTYSNFKFKL